jgi:hypothetical protein
VKSKVTLLLTEGAHLRFYGLTNGCSLERAAEELITRRNALMEMVTPIADGCHIVDQQEAVVKAKGFNDIIARLRVLLTEDMIFKSLIQQEIVNLYEWKQREIILD